KAVARQQEEKQLIGKILVSMGAISEAELQQMLQLKAEESIYDIFTWEEGDFEFFDDQLPAETMIRMKLDVQWLVLEGSRRLDEWRRIRESVPSPQTVPVLVTALEGIEVEEVEMRILGWIDDDRTVEEISQGAQTSLFLVSQIIAEQVNQGTVKAVRPRIIEVEVEVPAAAEKGQEAPPPAQAPPAQAPPAQAPPAQPYPVQQPGMMTPDQMQQMLSAYQAMSQMGQQSMPMPPFGQQMPPQSGFAPPAASSPIDVGSGRTLHYAGGGGGGAPAGQQAPPAQPASEADGLLQQAESSLQQGKLDEALSSFRKAKDAEGGGPNVDEAAKKGEEKLMGALERDGVKLSSVPKLKCGMEELTKLDISPQEGFMLTRVDGSYDVQSILKMSPMPKIDALMFFWKLRKAGHVGV
ncbi:MAG: DUF4388 domain-containing protein, partial [bacterium]|nr:DUF4388 domain-containing protein [bacterium]